MQAPWASLSDGADAYLSDRPGTLRSTVSRTTKRLIKAGKGPKITQISDRRIGVTVANNRKWQAARERPQPESCKRCHTP